MADSTQRQRLVWGDEKLEVLRNSHVVVAGVGGLGCVMAEQLARSGVGALTLIDRGVVDVPDLGRQVLYTHDDLGRVKVQLAARRLTKIAPDISIRTFRETIDEKSAFFKDIKALAFADCLDNYESRFALEKHLPPGAFMVHAGIQEERGQVTTIVAESGPSLQTIFAGAQQPASPIPVIPQCCSIVAGYQSLVVLNNLWWEAGLLPKDMFAGTLRGFLSIIDMLDATFSSIKLS